MKNIGVCMVAFGARAISAAQQAIDAWRAVSDLPVCVVSNARFRGATTIPFKPLDSAARWAKLNLDALSPFHVTLYLDADTETLHADAAHALDAVLDDFDVALAPSKNQGNDSFCHLQYSAERAATLAELQNPAPLQFQCGVLAFRKSAATLAVFAAWREEWMRWQDKDQAAFSRAIERSDPRPRIWLLSNEFNGGSLIAHHFGRAA